MYKIKTAPASEPISLTEAKAHLRVTGTEEESLISNLIVAARQEAENYLNRALISQTWYSYLDKFPADDSDNDYNIILHKCPVQSITAITYYDANNTIQTWAASNYILDAASEPARIQLASGVSYPATKARVNAVTIEFLTGYGAASTVPEAIKSGMYLYLGYLYDFRGDAGNYSVYVGLKPPEAIFRLWDPYRIMPL